MQIGVRTLRNRIWILIIRFISKIGTWDIFYLVTTTLSVLIKIWQGESSLWCLFSTRPRRCMGKWTYSSIYSSLWHLMVASMWASDFVHFTPEQGTHGRGGWVGPQLVWTWWQMKISCHCQESNPDHQTHSLVTTLTELHKNRRVFISFKLNMSYFLILLILLLGELRACFDLNFYTPSRWGER